MSPPERRGYPQPRGLLLDQVLRSLRFEALLRRSLSGPFGRASLGRPPDRARLNAATDVLAAPVEAPAVRGQVAVFRLLPRELAADLVPRAAAAIRMQRRRKSAAKWTLVRGEMP